MLRYTSFDIVFQEIPGEVTLAFNISGCPNRCKGCHSPHLQTNSGEKLTEAVIIDLLELYGSAITCVCFMGGDNEPERVVRYAQFVRHCNKKAAWYSGKSTIHDNAPQFFDYIKIGDYREELGGLHSTTTNQRLYKIENGTMIDITQSMQRSNRNNTQLNR
ncbi:MAG: anaerobic ribonucleoside-triphosphate reductase activating protein [Bacteroidales bacterium]|jgi:anaerobic ribonucleoside-triphosphate reductase activating protein|nr:anaerobic ribonucleoside-triphosphate reductase activating protein [Bacteroidales bacterium]